MTNFDTANPSALNDQTEPSRNGRASENGYHPEDGTGTAEDEARDALSHGWRVVPAERGASSPRFTGWSKTIIELDEVGRYFHGDNQNVCLLPGELSHGLVDIDLDCTEAIRLADTFLPPTGRIFGRQSKRRSHRLYLVDELLKRVIFEDPEASQSAAHKRMLVEIRTTGTATTWPGSQHHSGERVTWDVRGEPARIDGAEILQATRRLAAATLLARHYPAAGGRDLLKLSLTGALMYAGWENDEIATFMLAVAKAANDEEAERRVEAIERTRQRMLRGEPVAGWTALRGHVGSAAIMKRLREWIQPLSEDENARLRRQNRADFCAHLPDHTYVYLPLGNIWTIGSVNASVPPVVVGYDDDGEPITEKASTWLDTHQPVHGMTWAPGEPQIIEGKFLSEGGWIERADFRQFNSYRPPTIRLGDPARAMPWVEHVSRLYPDDAEHIIRWLAHRRQRPQEKINHALVLGGEYGIGKDSILVPFRAAIGPANMAEISQAEIMGRFSQYVRTVALHITEAKDQGDGQHRLDRYSFYEKMKTYTSAPPLTLSCELKYVDPFVVPNVMGVIYTYNDRYRALYLPPTDRRHYVAWSELPAETEPRPGYFRDFHRWLWHEEGCEHVAALLAEYDLSGFDPKAPPRKTPAFWWMVDASLAPEAAEIRDALEALGNPSAVTIQQIVAHVEKAAPKTGLDSMISDRLCVTELGRALTTRANWPKVPRWMEEAGYVVVQNPNTKDQRWTVGGRSATVYGPKELSPQERSAAARALAEVRGE